MRSVADYRAHVYALLTRYGLSLAESDSFERHYAFAAPQWGVVQCRTITDETSYAVALHEIGHTLTYQGGAVIEDLDPDDIDLMLVYDLLAEEYRAWEWAEAAALEWTLPMAQVRQIATDTYLRLLAVARRQHGV